MPCPPAFTVNTPAEYVALPACPTLPISVSSHPEGSGCDVVVKTIALLLFIPGATATTKYPEIAPAEIVAVIDASLHEFTAIGASLRNTPLVPREFPK